MDLWVLIDGNVVIFFIFQLWVFLFLFNSLLMFKKPRDNSVVDCLCQKRCVLMLYIYNYIDFKFRTNQNTTSGAMARDCGAKIIFLLSMNIFVTLLKVT